MKRFFGAIGQGVLYLLVGGVTLFVVYLIYRFQFGYGV